MVICILFLLLPQTVCSLSNGKCYIGEPLPILHKYIKPGNFIFSGIMSQIYIPSEQITFTRHPSEDLNAEAM